MCHTLSRFILISCLLFSLVLSTACGSSDQSSGSSSAASAEATILSASDAANSSDSAAASSSSVTFQDDLGRSVTVQSPKRVAVLIGSFADIWCLAGGKETIAAAGDDAWTAFDLGLPDTVVNIGGVKSPDVETILASDPDFIIASSNTSEDVDLKDIFEQSGIPTAYFNVSNFSDYLNMLKICTEITGHPENYETYGTQVEAQVNDARRKASEALDRNGASVPSCLYVRATASSVKVKGSRDNVLGEMLKDLGAVNIADSDTGLLENLSMESILADNPDFIFTVVQGATREKQAEAEAALAAAMTGDPAWSSLSAVINGHYYTMDNALYNLKPNARWGEAYQNLEDILYGSGSV